VGRRQGRIEARRTLTASPRPGVPFAQPHRRILAALSLAASAHAAAPAQKGSVEVNPTAKKGQAGATKVVKLSATVKAVDAAKRELTLEGKNGQVQTVKVPPEVKRFDEIAAGDTITVQLEQGLLLEYQPAGSEVVEPKVEAAAGRAEPGSAPAGAVAAAVQSTVEITAIDLKNRMVVFQGPQGGVYQVKAGPKVQIEKLKVGDKLLATYAEAVAIKLEKAAKKEPAKKEPAAKK
jgi:hypothetical protein